MHKAIEQWAVAVGRDSECMRTGKTDDRNLRKFEQAAWMGIHQPGTTGRARLDIIKRVAEFARRMQPLLAEGCKDEILESVPLDDASQQEAWSAAIREEHQENNYRFEFLRGKEGLVSDAVRETAGDIRAIMEGTAAYRANDAAALAALHVATVMGTSESLGYAIGNMVDTRGGTRPIGIPIMATNAIAASAASLSLRPLLAHRPGIADALKDYSTSRMRAYAAPYKLQGRIATLDVVRHLITTSLFDAEMHRKLGAAIPALQEIQWPEEEAPLQGLPEGRMSMVMNTDAHSLRYLWSRKEDNILEKASIREDGPEEAAQFVVREGRTIISLATSFADISEELLPAGARKTLENIMRTMRFASCALLDSQPFLRSSLRDLRDVHGSFEEDRAVIACPVSDGSLMGGILVNGRPFGPDDSSCFENNPEYVQFAVPLPWKTDAKEKNTADKPAEHEAEWDLLFDGLPHMRHMQFAVFERMLRSLGIVERENRGRGSHFTYENPLSRRCATMIGDFSKSQTFDVPMFIVKQKLRELDLLPEQSRRLRSWLVQEFGTRAMRAELVKAR